MINSLPFEWFILLLRICFIFLLYFFLFQIVRVILRELQSEAAATHDEGQSDSSGSGHLIVQGAGRTGLRRGARLELEPVTVIGRHPRSTIRIDDSFVSTEHAQIAWNDGSWWITDLNSTNGTLLNGQPVVAPEILKFGDVIQLGDIALQVAP